MRPLSICAVTLKVNAHRECSFISFYGKYAGWLARPALLRRVTSQASGGSAGVFDVLTRGLQIGNNLIDVRHGWVAHCVGH